MTTMTELEKRVRVYRMSVASNRATGLSALRDLARGLRSMADDVDRYAERVADPETSDYDAANALRWASEKPAKTSFSAADTALGAFVGMVEYSAVLRGLEEANDAS